MERHEEGISGINRMELESLTKALTSNRSPQFLKGIALSLKQGGTMLKVLPLAKSGMTPIEIKEALQISYQSVVSSEKHLRHWGLIGESRVQRTRRLLSELTNLPDSFEDRQSIIDSISFRFHRDNPYFFETFTRLIRNAGKSNRIGAVKLAEFLKSNQIATRVFLRPNDYRYGIILAAEDQMARELLTGFPNRITNPS